MANKLKRDDVVALLEKAGIKVEKETTWAQLRPVYDKFIENCFSAAAGKSEKNPEPDEKMDTKVSTHSEQKPVDSETQKQEGKSIVNIEQNLIEDKTQMQKEKIKKLDEFLTSTRSKIAQKMQEISAEKSDEKSPVSMSIKEATKSDAQNQQKHEISQQPLQQQQQSTQLVSVNDVTQTTKNLQSQPVNINDKENVTVLQQQTDDTNRGKAHQQEQQQQQQHQRVLSKFIDNMKILK